MQKHNPKTIEAIAHQIHAVASPFIKWEAADETEKTRCYGAVRDILALIEKAGYTLAPAREKKDA